MTAATDTKAALLDAAEAAFGEVGFQRASIRQIVARAGVNLASVHYHFGSKQALLEAVFDRCVGPVNRERLELLAAAEEAAGDGKPGLEAVLRAFLEPLLRHGGRQADRRERMRRLYGRLMGEPADELRRMMQRQFSGILRRFGEAFQRAAPGLPKEDLIWRMFFTTGAAAHLLMDPPGLKRFTKGTCDPSDTETVLQQLIRYAMAGFEAPPVTRRKGRR